MSENMENEKLESLDNKIKCLELISETWKKNKILMTIDDIEEVRSSIRDLRINIKQHVKDYNTALKIINRISYLLIHQSEHGEINDNQTRCS